VKKYCEKLDEPLPKMEISHSDSYAFTERQIFDALNGLENFGINGVMQSPMRV
jgi:hypothetical protein